MQTITPSNVKAVTKHEEYPWITLLSCKGYDAKTGTYKYRIIVRAVQMDIK